jgi:hypothetical protein
MAGCLARGSVSRTPHPRGNPGLTVRYDFIYCIRSAVFRFIFLGLLS